MSRVMEMGFPRDQVISALSSSGWNEEAAINVLLGGDQAPPPAPGATHPPGNAAPPAAPANNPTSRGGFFWGRK